MTDIKQAIELLERMTAEPAPGEDARLDADELDAVLLAIKALKTPPIKIKPKSMNNGLTKNNQDLTKTSGDVISRDVLKDIWALYKKYQPRLATNVYEFGVALRELIDNAPTIEPRGWQIEYLKKVFEKVRPHGEWEEPFESNGKTYHKCNHCHISSELILFDNFCPHCGALMTSEVTT